MNESAPRQPSILDAITELMVIERRVRDEGAVDIEPDVLNQIRNKLQSGELNPTEAITRARDFLASRQSYH